MNSDLNIGLKIILLKDMSKNELEFKKIEKHNLKTNNIIKGFSEVLIPSIVLFASFLLQIILSFYEGFDITESLFNISVLFLFGVSLYLYRKEEKEEDKSHYIISYWIVTIIFIAKLFTKLAWYFL